MKRVRLSAACLSAACLSTAIVAFSILNFCPLSLAQVAGGSVSGAVKDSSGAALPAAKVTIRNTETQVTRSVAVNDDGFYLVPNLVPGNYEIAASAAGFGTAVQPAVTITIGAQVVADIALSPGSVDTRIEVTGTPMNIELSTSSLDATLNSTTVRELPLNGRDWTLLATLQPGVTTVDQSPLAISNQRANRGLGTQLSVGGNRPQGNNYRVDGISINDYSNGGPGSILGVVLGVEAVQEFSVVTNNAPASYGRTSGGVINSLTRSGTNELHGSAYEFLRNSDLDARNFFDPKNVPPFRRNQFGADAGGPIVKDKTFIFGDYEGVRQSLTTTQVDVVPTAAARTGQLVAGNVVVDPKVVPYLALYPLPNGAINGDTGIFNLATGQTTREDFFTTRIDHTISAKNTLFGTYQFDDGRTTGPDAFDTKVIATQSRRQAAIIEDTQLISAKFTNTVRFGYSRVTSEAPKTLNALNPVAADTTLGFLPGLPVGVITATGLTLFPGGVGAVGEYDFRFNSFQLYDDAFAIFGAHQLKFGFSFERIRDNELGKASPAGQFIFGSLAAFLTDQPTSFNAPIGGVITPRGIRQSIVGGYFLDDWRILPNLTLNLGLRYEPSTVPSEVQGKLSNLPSLTSSTPHLGSPFFSNPTKLDIEPRVGFSYDPFKHGTTSIRGGFGIFDNLPLPYLFELTSILSAPFFELGNISKLPQGSFPTQAFTLLNTPTLRYAYIQPNPPRSYVMQWNFNIQQQLFKDTVLTVGYTGSRGVHLPYFVNDFDIVLPSSTPQGWLWPVGGTRLNTNVGQISGTLWNADSIYHALQVNLTRQLSKGLQAGLSYAFGKSIDTGSSSLASDTFANSAQRLYFDPREGRGLSDFDIRHNFTFNYIWALPKFKSGPAALHWVADGWQWGGILHVASGEPFTAQIGGDAAGMLGAAPFDRPNLVTGPGCSGSLVNSGNPLHYIKTQCFTFPNPKNLLGDAGRNILTGPGILNLDSSLFKNIGRSERYHAQFRAEFFNILNHTNFASPLSNTSVFGANGTATSNAGVITATTTTSRQIQFGLKLLW